MILYAPTTAYVRLGELLSDDGASVAYDAVVDWTKAPSWWYPPRHAVRRESRLPPQWRVVSDNASLAKALELRVRRPVSVVPPAVDPPFLNHPWAPMSDREACLGWFGAIRSETDAALLCAASRAGLHVETIGPVEDEEAGRCLRAAGVITRPSAPIQELPAYCQHWRVVVLAYTGPRSPTITPAKLLNALAGFRVAVRGIHVPDPYAAQVCVLPDDDAVAVGELRSLVGEGAGGPWHPPEHLVGWADRLCAITEGAR